MIGNIFKGKKFHFKQLKEFNWTKKKILLIVFALVVIAAGIFGYMKIFASNENEDVITAKVTKGEITVSIEGSGVVEPIEMYNITSLAKGDILQSNFEEGQEVKKGDLLYVIDTKDIENSIEKAELSLEKQKLSHEQTIDSYDGLSVTTPISGIITECYVKKGDSVQSGSKIADVINKDYMILEIPFNSNDASKINAGDEAQVSLENAFYETKGTVMWVSSGNIISSSGATVSTVKIKVKNPGSITAEDKATAIINNMACNSSGTFDYYEQKTITAKTSGEVTNVVSTTGDEVDSGDVIINLQSDDALVQLKQSEITLADSELSLQNTKDQLDDYNITSPISGTVLEKTSKAGDTIDNSSDSTVMAVIADMSKLTFDIDVDELDIGKIELGQEVQVTADSLEGKTFKGTISNISKIGSSTDGVATYPVTVEMENTGDLMIGMNVNAEIVIESKENVLKIPSSALSRGNRVLVKDEDGSKAASQEESLENESKNIQSSTKSNTNTNKGALSAVAPDGYTYVKVEIGISNTDYVEITSGLEEGDIVVVPTEETASTTNNNQMMPGGGIPTGGGMPTGGEMPSGGGRP